MDSRELPDTFDNDRHFVFLHGFKVDEEAVQAWHAEMFKRLFHSGSNAMYTGILWNGNDGLANGLVNYWGNVENALNTSEALTNILQQSLSGELSVSAYSLGNMVLSSAIQDHGLQVDHYLMLNPAVAVESYNASQLAEDVSNGTNLMSDTDWHHFEEVGALPNPRRL